MTISLKIEALNEMKQTDGSIKRAFVEVVHISEIGEPIMANRIELKPTEPTMVAVWDNMYLTIVEDIAGEITV